MNLQSRYDKFVFWLYMEGVSTVAIMIGSGRWSRSVDEGEWSVLPTLLNKCIAIIDICITASINI